jgi:hypothetical protein
MRIAQRTACADDFLSAHTVRSPHQRTQIRPWATFSCRPAGWWPALRRRCIDIFSNEAGLMKQLTIKALFWAMALASALLAALLALAIYWLGQASDHVAQAERQRHGPEQGLDGQLLHESRLIAEDVDASSAQGGPPPGRTTRKCRPRPDLSPLMR